MSGLILQNESAPFIISVTALAFVLGSIVGSFLGVVVPRLPKILFSQASDLSDQLGAESKLESGLDSGHEDNLDNTSHSHLSHKLQTPLGFRYLAYPGSHCMECEKPLSARHNIPILSYLLLKGRCAFCEKSIPTWHFWIELLCALWWMFCAYQYGLTWSALAYCLYGSALICLGFIDWQTTILPDIITYPVLWGGLISSSLNITQLPLIGSVWGAVIGYMSLWVISRAYFAVRGQVGLGDGDLKLVAAIGAWIGPLPLIWLLLVASLGGITATVILRIQKKLEQSGLIPFGPFIVGAALLITVLNSLPLIAPLINFSGRF